MFSAAVVYSSIPRGRGVASVHGLSYTSPNCLIIPVLSDGNATTFASYLHVSKGLRTLQASMGEVANGGSKAVAL